MESWLNIIIDIGVLAFIGLLYYFFQKRRIIKVTHEMIIQDLSEYRLKVNEFIEQKVKSKELNKLQEFADLLDKIYQTQDLESFHHLIQYQDILSQKLSNQLSELNNQVIDLLQSK